MFRGTLLSLGCGLSMLVIASASIFLLSDWSTHSRRSLALAFCIAIAACFPAWQFWQRRQAIASNYPVVERADDFRFRHGTKVQLFVEKETLPPPPLPPKHPTA